MKPVVMEDIVQTLGSWQGTGAALRPSCQRRIAMEMHIAVIAQTLPDEKVPAYPVTHRAGTQAHSAQAIGLLHAEGHDPAWLQ